MCDSGGKASDRRQAIAQADFIFQAADFREIRKSVNVTDDLTIMHPERSHGEAEYLFAVRGGCAQLTLHRIGLWRRQWVEKQRRDLGSEDIASFSPEKVLPRLVDQGNAMVKACGNETTPHRTQ